MAKENSSLKYLSNLKALLNIFEKLQVIAKNKQKIILEQNWNELYSISEEQKEINCYFDNTMKYLEMETADIKSTDIEIKKIKKEIKEKIMSYKEIENTNLRLLNDSFFFAKQKVEKIFNKKLNGETYNKEMKMVKDLWDNSPIILDRLI